VLNREFIFSHASIIKFQNDNFISVVGDDWFRRRAKDDASIWFREIARKAGRGKNGSTQQGCYLVTARGDLLAFINTSNPKKFASSIVEGKKRWDQLKPEQRKVAVPAMKNSDYKVNVRPIEPTKDLVIEVQSRVLSEVDGKIVKWDSKGKVGSKPTLGHLWIKQSEWAEIEESLSLLNTLNRATTVNAPKVLIHRIARFHLTDNTRGEGPAWKNDEIKEATLEFTRIADGFRVTGKFHLETADKNRSFTGNLQGKLTLETGKSPRPKTWTMTVYGKHSGEGPHTRNARPGAQPLAFTFDFLPKPKPLDLVPPQHMRWQKGYWEAAKH